MDFKDVEQYCIAKRDETLTIFLEMENFILVSKFNERNDDDG